MIQRYSNKDIPNWGEVFAVFDIVVIFSVSYLCFGYVYEQEQLNAAYILSIVVLTLFVILISYLSGTYRYWVEASVSRELRAIITAWVISIALMTFLAYVFRVGTVYSRMWFGLTVVGAMTIICLSRLAFRQLMNKYRTKGWNQQNIIIIGQHDHALKISATISEQVWVGMNIARVVDFSQLETRQAISDDDIRVSVDELDGYLQQSNSGLNADTIPVSQVWLLMEDIPKGLTARLLSILEIHSVDIVYVPDLSFIADEPYNLIYSAGIPVVVPTISSLASNQKLIKGLEDSLLAFLALLLVGPLMVLIAVGVKLSSPGPIFYRQLRVTTHGKHFNMLKFRSMPVDTEFESGPVWAKPGENRATRFGSFIRRTSLDELPQFINVLKGQMSIVGPRPERPEFVERFKTEIPDYMKKHLLKAGITGWAQVNGYRGDTSLQKRIEYDIFYINHWSLMFDFRIMLMTLCKGFVNKSAY